MPISFSGQVRRGLCLWDGLNVDTIVYSFGSVLPHRPSPALSDCFGQVL